MTPSSKYDHVFAIIRIDDFHGNDVPMSVKVTVKKIVWDEAEANREVDRLNALRPDPNVYYFAQVTRLERVPSAASCEELGTISAQI